MAVVRPAAAPSSPSAEAPDVERTSTSAPPETGRLRVETWCLWVPFAIAVALTFAITPEDPFITLRYAFNLLHGHGAVFNPSQRVDGATSATGLILSVGALLAPGGHALLKMKLVSLAFGILSVWMAKRLVDTFDWPRPARLGALVLVGVSPIVALASASGMETTVMIFAVTGLMVELRTGHAFRRPWRTALLGSLAVVTRPEGLGLVAAVLVVAILLERQVALTDRIRWAVGPLVTEAIVLGASRIYYGSALPNTYAAKDLPLAAAWHRGLSYLFHGWILDYTGTTTAGHVLGGALCVFVAGLFLGGLVLALRRPHELGYLAAIAVAQMAFTLRAGGDWMIGSRFLAPVTPTLIVLGVATGVAVWSRLDRSKVVGCFLLGGLLAATAFTYWPKVSGSSGWVWRVRGLSDQSLVAHGGYPYSSAWADAPSLLACAPHGDVVALTEVGYGAFADPSLRVLDLRGLTNREVASTSPAAIKHPWGVQDLGWYLPSSPVGKVILRAMPVAILTLDEARGEEVLDGHYRLDVIDDQPGSTSFLYSRSGGPCDGYKPAGDWVKS